MSDRITVNEFDDIVTKDLSRKEMESVARSLNDGVSSVLVMEEWLVDAKDLESVDGEHRIFVGSVQSETDKAWLYAVGESEDWIPKSTSLVFESGTDEEIETPQRGLGEFEVSQ